MAFKKTKKRFEIWQSETTETLIFRIFEKNSNYWLEKKKEDNASIDYLLSSIDGSWILLVPHIFGCHWDEINGLVSYGSMLIKGYTPMLAGY